MGTADPPRGGAGGDAYLHETEIAGNVAGYLFRGDGRTRTAVQANHHKAFYMLILPLVVGNGLPADGLPESYSLSLRAL